MKTKHSLLVLILSIVLIFSFNTSATAAEAISVYSGSAGGSWYPIGAGIANVLSKNGLKASVELGGGISNIIALSQKKGDTGFTNGFVPAMAANGEKPFSSKITNLKGLAVLMDNTTQVVVTQKSGVKSFKDLKGKSFISLPLSASSTIAFQKVLLCYDMKESDMKISRGNMSFGASQIKDRNAIGYHATTAFPNGSISELAASLKIRLLGIDDSAYQRLKKINAGFVRTKIPANTYKGQNEEIQTVGAPTIYISRDDLPNEVAYKIVKILAENIKSVNAVHASLKKLTPKKLATVSGLDIHPGAEKYYREAGLLK
ncbi:TAXI family TRAP transporter solute-binding subunit [Thermodesulfobacteriota bacterium]